MKDMRNIAIMGSTGSIGRQTLDIVSEYPDLFKAWVLVANNSADLLIEQALKYRPHTVVIANEALYDKVKTALADTDIEVQAGDQAVADCVTAPEIDTVVTAMVGYSGLAPTIKAIGAGKKIALANKETLVVAGDLITRLLATSKSVLYPVDSEHGAFYQCLVGERHQDINKLILTASGGPFRTFTKEQLEHVTAADALKHPNWSMGAKITIDSASMMNKGFEMIEARWLFDVPASRINVVVHPESIIHSMVEFVDGAVIAQLGCPDMREPIAFAMSFPDRISIGNRKLDFASLGALHFEAPDFDRFPNLRLAYEAIETGGNAGCALNAANEVAVAAYLDNRISFYDISAINEACLRGLNFVAKPTLDDIFQTNDEAAEMARKLVAGK